ncbi:MAG: aspartate kinase [Flavobacteriaceae bacterium]|jgi:aspartate kinase|nr:aspartate kinase [Flavobacteriaceae bacterium]
MKVYKFGGASVKDAQSVKNVATVLNTSGYGNTLIVVSAMGKTTNALEEVVRAYFNRENHETLIKNVENHHLNIAKELFSKKEKIFDDIQLFFSDINSFLRRNKSPNYNFVYDQVVSSGELISTKIVSAYLNSAGIVNTWLDVRDFIKCDSTYREGKVDWSATQQRFENFDTSQLYVTQGFIAADSNYFTVTLGREGSDYSAAIIAYCLNAESMTIWKDVPGVMNADPKEFPNVRLLHSISYEETIELAFYGASVLHPKTLQPLRRKEIPLFVRSFLEPEKAGTSVKKGQPLDPLTPCFILKKDEHLLHISSRDFSFMQEENLSLIFAELSRFNLKVNLISVSAISVSLCVEDKFNNINKLIKNLEKSFALDLTQNVALYTVRHYTPEAQKNVAEGKEILLEQTLKNTYQLIVKQLTT